MRDISMQNKILFKFNLLFNTFLIDSHDQANQMCICLQPNLIINYRKVHAINLAPAIWWILCMDSDLFLDFSKTNYWIFIPWQQGIGIIWLRKC